MTPFDFIKSINQQNYQMDVLVEEQYVPYITNRNFSLFADTILQSNEMNLNGHLDKKMQYDYLFNTIAKKNRFKQWPKKTNVTPDNINLICHYYKYNTQKAKQVLSFLTDLQIELIRKKVQQGGVT
jgi:hypothetical protein